MFRRVLALLLTLSGVLHAQVLECRGVQQIAELLFGRMIDGRVGVSASGLRVILRSSPLAHSLALS